MRPDKNIDTSLDLLTKDIVQGNKEAFQKLFELYFDRLVIFAQHFVIHQDIAKDIVQDAYLYIWEQRLSLSIHTSLKSYLFKIVHNSCLRNLARQKLKMIFEQSEAIRLLETELFYFDSIETSSGNLIYKELRELIMNSIQMLPERTKQAFLYSRKDGLPFREIALKMSISVKAVEDHISRSLRILRTALKEYL